MSITRRSFAPSCSRSHSAVTSSGMSAASAGATSTRTRTPINDVRTAFMRLSVPPTRQRGTRPGVRALRGVRDEYPVDQSRDRRHDRDVSGVALSIEEVFRDAGFPRGVFATVLVGSSAVAGLIADPRIVAVTLT